MNGFIALTNAVHPTFCNATFIQKITQTITPKQCNALHSDVEL